MTTDISAQRIIKAAHLLLTATLSPTSAWLSKLALALGIAYLFIPLDLIPDRIPIIGHADEAGFLVFGLIFSYLLIPAEFSEKSLAEATSILQPPVLSGTPNFFIVGAARCGTTSLFEAISQHPDVFCCPVKEPNYFAFEARERDAAVAEARSQAMLIEGRLSRVLAAPMVALVDGYEAYKDLFREWSGERAVGEASTSYLPSAVAAKAIASYCPHARIIIILRDPVARAYSDYLMLQQLGHDLGSFDVALQREQQAIQKGGDWAGRGIIRSSCYAPQIRRYLAHFPRRQLLFVTFEELTREPEATLQRVFRHIGVDPKTARHIRITLRNESRSPRIDWINRALFRSGKKWLILRAFPRPLRRFLARFYYAQNRPSSLSVSERKRWLELFRSDIEETAALIYRDLSHWVGTTPT